MNHHGILHRHAHLGAYNAARLLVFLDGLHDLLVPPGQIDDPQRIDHFVIRDNAMEEACGDKAVQVLVISRLDFCNSFLTGLPAKAIRPLQLIQNRAARLMYVIRLHFEKLLMAKESSCLMFATGQHEHTAMITPMKGRQNS
ncbi:unnamed protein product [Pleuronectes platessa]|uniref:Uncharacterized protein n=1 Tax=Pleuronectes platessa TaxID=8262 RepID=A0A9N7YLV0_PLEPL|nr:unnamed protein product [Pleuronectes platessa]